MSKSVALLVMAFCISVIASNMTVDVQFNSVNPNVIVQLNSASPVDTNQVYAGGYLSSVSIPADSNAGPYLGTITNPVQMFCVDLAASAGNHTATLVNPASAPIQAGYSNGVSGYPMGEARADWLGILTNSYWNSGYLTSSNHYAALQVAVWEIVFEGANANSIPATWNVATGDFMITNPIDVIAESNRILNNITGFVGSQDISNMIQMNLGILSSNSYQDMLVRTTTTIPEPSMAILALLASVALLPVRRPRKVCSEIV